MKAYIDINSCGGSQLALGGFPCESALLHVSATDAL